MRTEFCNRFLNIWSGFGAFPHVGNLAEMFDGMNIRVIEESNTLGRPGQVSRHNKRRTLLASSTGVLRFSISIKKSLHLRIPRGTR